jgi:hypothetical protein
MLTTTSAGADEVPCIGASQPQHNPVPGSQLNPRSTIRQTLEDFKWTKLREQTILEEEEGSPEPEAPPAAGTASVLTFEMSSDTASNEEDLASLRIAEEHSQHSSSTETEEESQVSDADNLSQQFEQETSQHDEALRTANHRRHRTPTFQSISLSGIKRGRDFASCDDLGEMCGRWHKKAVSISILTTRCA